MKVSKTEAIEKVRKLLELADRPGTEQEGVSARAIAERLRAKHGITDSDLIPPIEFHIFFTPERPKRSRKPRRTKAAWMYYSPVDKAEHLLRHQTIPDSVWTSEKRRKGEDRTAFIFRVLRVEYA